MVYDSKTYGASPFGASVKTPAPTPTAVAPKPSQPKWKKPFQKKQQPKTEEPMSDTFQAPPEAAQATASSPAPAEPLAIAVPHADKVGWKYLPYGLSKQNILIECGVWGVFWSAYGFYRVHLPSLALASVEHVVFSSSGMAVALLLNGYIASRWCKALNNEFAALQRQANAVTESKQLANYGDIAFTALDALATGRKQSAQVSRQFVTLSTFLASYVIVSSLFSQP